MDKTWHFFMSGQTKDVSTSNQNDASKQNMTAPKNIFHDMTSNDAKHIQNNAADGKRKDNDNFFYILWHS